ncbi:MAG: hypothetical protein JO051_02095 [Acidobacteriaceae bacterium]|nr:hypothetical protein [Acidobacteriaceae bacterium]
MDAFSLRKQRERRRLEILAAVDKAQASLARGEGRRVTTREEARELALGVERRGLTRLNLDLLRLAAPEPEVLRVIGEESQLKSTDKLTSRQIDNEIKAARAKARMTPRRLVIDET